MPEGPEIYKTCAYINAICSNRLFGGKILKSAVNWKNPDVPYTFEEYAIQSDSRGKELMIHLIPKVVDKKPKESMKGKDKLASINSIRFHFGMSGKFTFCKVADLEKHSHLMFYTVNEKPEMVLSFVDVRRFGRWHLTNEWSTDRGPDPIRDHRSFRYNILTSLEEKAFSKPICEVMLNQKYFNGIGNYLRAEILYRNSIPPFMSAREVLKNLPLKAEGDATEDIIELCHSVPNEVTLLRESDDDCIEEVKYGTSESFMSWLKCYSNSEMKNLVDHDGRTIWFEGEAGPLAPKGGKSRGNNASPKKKSEGNIKDKKTKSEDSHTTTKVDSVKAKKRRRKLDSNENTHDPVSPMKIKTEDCTTTQLNNSEGTVTSGKLSRKDSNKQNNLPTTSIKEETRAIGLRRSLRSTGKIS